MRKFLAKFLLIITLLTMTGILPALASYSTKTVVSSTGSTVVSDVSRSMGFAGNSGSRVRVDNINFYSGVSSSTSVYVEFKATSSTPSDRQTLVNFGSSSGSTRHSLQLKTDNSLTAAFWNSTSYTGKKSTILTVGKWYRAIYTHDGVSVSTLSVEGINQTSTAIDNQTDGNATLVIGSRLSNQGFQGNINTVRIWNRVLTTAEKISLYAGSVSKSGLVEELLFNSLSTSTAYDTSGNGNNGTITGAVPSTDTPPNVSSDTPLNPTVVSDVSRSMGFATSTLITGAGNYTVTPTESRTFALKFKPTKVSNYIFSRNTGSGDGLRVDIRSDGKLRTVWETNVTTINQSTTNLVKLNQWNDVVIVITDVSINIYLNGILTSSSFSSRTFNSVTSLIFGKWYTGSLYFFGNLDDLRVYSRALSASEVSNLYRGIVPRNGLVGEWLGDNDFKDSSGLGNDGVGTNVTFDTSTPQ